MFVILDVGFPTEATQGVMHFFGKQHLSRDWFNPSIQIFHITHCEFTDIPAIGIVDTSFIKLFLDYSCKVRRKIHVEFHVIDYCFGTGSWAKRVLETLEATLAFTAAMSLATRQKLLK